MRTLRLAAAALALALAATAATVAFPAAAGAGILAPDDAAELANALAEAQEEQGVCYGWNVTNDFDYQADVGSSTGGPGVQLDPRGCANSVILEGDIHYACSSCEDSDRAIVSVRSTLPGGPTARDLEDLGLRPDALTGDVDDVTLANMIGALPLLASQTGAVPPVPAEVPASVPATDRPTNQPGSDLLRDSWLTIVFFLFLLAAGPALFFYKRSQSRALPRPKET